MRVALYAALAVMWVCFAGHLLYVTAGIDAGPLPASFFSGWVHHAGYVATAAACAIGVAMRLSSRRSWVWLAAAVGFWTSGSVYWVVFVDGTDAMVSPADFMWLAFYPLAYCFVLRRTRETVSHMPASAWLDGLVAGLAAAAAASLLVPAALDAGYESPAIAAIYLAYPISDLAILALIVGTLAVSSWRVTRDWWLVGCGFALFAVADLFYLRQNATGSYELGTILDAGWAGGMVLMTHGVVAGRRTARRASQVVGRRVLVVPTASMLLALAVLVYASLRSVHELTLVLATLSILAAGARASITLREVRALSITRRQAVTDDLTELPNRRLFRERLAEAVTDAQERRRGGDNARLALIVLDLDRFKEVNDTLGHQAGDLVLREVAERFAAAVSDATLARLGGDEFAMLLAGDTPAEDAMAAVAAIQEILEQPLSLNGLDLMVEASLGIALYPEHGRSAEELFRHADVAMYQAKRERSTYRVYAPEADEHSWDRLILMGSLRRAISEGELVLHYQPQIALDTGAIVGLEALVRWQHPQKGLLPPDAFLPAAEYTGLMKALSRNVLESALAQLARWRAEGLATTVAVNLSASDLLDAGLVDEVRGGLDRYGLPPSALRLELTETMLINDLDRAVRITRALRDHGIALSLDDFGTGHSTFAHITKLPLEEIKIDRSFVQAVTASQPDAVIVTSTIRMAHELGLTVVAEGVEDRAMRDALVAADCDRAQGYLFARPLPAGEVTELLAAPAPAAPAPAML